MKETIYYLAQQTVQPKTDAPKAKGASSFFDPSLLLMIGGMFLLMYFLLIRPQRKEEKRKKSMLSALQKGDPVVTSSGIIGTVASVKETSVFVNVGDGNRIEFLRSSINQVRKNEIKPTAKTNKSKG